MRWLVDRMSRWVAMLGVVVTLMVPQLGYSQAVKEDPSMLAMAGDLFLARPLLLATTVGGAAVYLVGLPFALAGGNAKEAGETLVVGPARATFVRCLGCTRSGYKKDIED